MDKDELFQLPEIHTGSGTLARHYHAHFMRHYNNLAEPDPVSRVKEALEIVARDTGETTSSVARLMVESGLRAPKRAFPEDYIQRLEGGTFPQEAFNASALTASQRALLDGWHLQETKQAESQIKAAPVPPPAK